MGRRPRSGPRPHHRRPDPATPRPHPGGHHARNRVSCRSSTTPRPRRSSPSTPWPDPWPARSNSPTPKSTSWSPAPTTPTKPQSARSASPRSTPWPPTTTPPELNAAWAGDYLTGRLGQDITGHPDIRPGYAPAAWTALVTHLRRHGVTDDELLASGLASTARTGRLIDRFRDRLVLPITHDGQVLGFVGRRHPALTDADHAGPKYLNTPDTVAYHKGAQLYGPIPTLLDAGATPVLVEGPIDALAVTLAGGG